MEGAANARAIAWLARDVFGVPLRAVTLVRGERSRQKTFGVDLPEEAVRDALARALADR